MIDRELTEEELLKRFLEAAAPGNALELDWAYEWLTLHHAEESECSVCVFFARAFLRSTLIFILCVLLRNLREIILQ